MSCRLNRLSPHRRQGYVSQLDPPAATLLYFQVEFLSNKEQLQFTPTIDGKVFEGSVVKSIKEKKFAKLPYIIGCNSTEGQGLLSLNAGPNFSQGLSEEQARKGVFFPVWSMIHYRI